ncbi:response regulator transcription factor [Facilibium subflavum]|uniref:response regulator transcription factor n=1 Tax=Facilibium subflavum TaxID=2219058 RepID=UPI000E64E4B5
MIDSQTTLLLIIVYAGLSKRQHQIARMLILGASAKEIALKLSLSYRTVETHINNIKQKLNCHKRSELITHLHQIGV